MFDRTNELLASIDHNLQMIASNLSVMVKIMADYVRKEGGKGCDTSYEPSLLPVPPRTDMDCYIGGRKI